MPTGQPNPANPSRAYPGTPFLDDIGPLKVTVDINHHPWKINSNGQDHGFLIETEKRLTKNNEFYGKSIFVWNTLNKADIKGSFLYLIWLAIITQGAGRGLLS